MAPTFDDLGNIALMGILLGVPFVILGALPFAMVLAIGVVLATCIFCRSL